MTSKSTQPLFPGKSIFFHRRNARATVVFTVIFTVVSFFRGLLVMAGFRRR